MSVRPQFGGARRKTFRKPSLETLEDRSLLAADLLIPTFSGETRSIDGTGNNLDNPEWGSTDEQLLRTAAAEYGDGISTPAGADRPSAREISNTLAAQEDEAFNDRQMSAFIYVFGQFVDHDIDLSLSQGAGGESFPISVPTDDALFNPDGSDSVTIPFTRSQFDPDTGTSTDNPRQQVNAITSFLDASTVYGSDQATADSLRTWSLGMLKTSDGDLLPTDADGNFLAGDIRVNDNVELMSVQTLFLREHNFWAGKIHEQNPGLTDEQIYQQARAIVIAEIQAITYNEFLPALLGKGAIAPYSGYDSSVNPGIANEFSTGAYRLGHSLVNDDVEFFGNDGRAVHEEVPLAEAFLNPGLLQETGIDSILKYSASTQAQELDSEVVDGLRNFLFGPPGAGGLDLASLNIQRGRDHGLADYNAVRAAYGLDPVTSFDEISSDPEVQAKLASLYGDVDNIDLWVGAIAEDHVPGASVGETIKAILTDQFTRIRDGDRFWYQNVFHGASLRQLEHTTLTDVIKRNTDVTNLQQNAFFMRAEVQGTVFADGNGGFGHRGPGLAGVTVELLDNEGEIVASTATDRAGHYHFTEFNETGDYQVRVVLPPGQTATGPSVIDILISRGDTRLRNLDFGVRAPAGPNHGGPHGGNHALPRLNPVDIVLGSDRFDARPRHFRFM